jgi:hypothetical protein
MSVKIVGYIHDAIADISPGGSGDITEVEVNGVSVAVSSVDDDRD